MEVKLTCSPSYTMAYCYLTAGESVLVEQGAMAAMSGGMKVSAGIGPGGMVKAAMRKTLGGEGFFMGRYTAEIHGAWVGVASRYPGDMAVEQFSGNGLVIEQGALVAVSQHMDVDVKMAGLRNMVMQEGITMLRLSGNGSAVIGSYGGLQRFELGEGEQLIVDTGHLVGFSDTMRMRVGPLSSVTTSVVTGEGLVSVLEGPGIVLMQTRAEQNLRSWLFPDKAQNTGKR